MRLLSRFLALYANPKGKGAQDILWAGAEAMVHVKGISLLASSLFVLF